jgi:omega-6 fatty acid desaturase (delta-12 desaturase)
MVMFQPKKTSRERTGFRIGKLITLVFAAMASAAAYRWAGGAVGVLAAVVVPFIVFNYWIAMLVFLHHTHPDVPFFDQRAEWSNSLGQVYCSIVVRTWRPLELLLHDIMIHVPHHVDPRIPFYRLTLAYADLQRHYGQYIHEYRFRWSLVRGIFRSCQLYDFKKQRWYTFRDASAMCGAP